MPTNASRLALTVATAAIFAALVSGAGAKGVSQVAICGVDRCRDVTAADAGSAIVFPMGKVVRPPRVSAPFVRVVGVITAPLDESKGTDQVLGRPSYLYVPSLRLIRAQRQRKGESGTRAVWQRADALLVQNLTSLIWGLKRFRAQRLDLIGHSPKVTMPERLGSHPTTETPSQIAAPQRPGAAGGSDGAEFPWWTIGVALALGAAAGAARLRRAASGPHAT
jgi:hypothetical protein